MRLVVGITGATGAPIAVRALHLLHELGVETHLVLSRWGKATLEMETGLTATDLRPLVARLYAPGDQAAAIASGSMPTDGMLVLPCSMRTLAAIRIGHGDGLVTRAADVTIKEGRRLVLVPRELPFSQIHLEHMLALSTMGVRIVAPVPAFYHRPTTVDEIVTHIAVRVLDQLGLQVPGARRWEGPPKDRSSGPLDERLSSSGPQTDQRFIPR